MAAAKEPERYFGTVLMDDGCTLVADIQDADKLRGPMRVWYRPALPETVEDYKLVLGRCTTGLERIAAQCQFINAHLERWQGLSRRNKDAAGATVMEPVEWKKGKSWSDSSLADPSVRRALGVEYLNQLSNLIGGYTPGQWEEDAKN